MKTWQEKINEVRAKDRAKRDAIRQRDRQRLAERRQQATLLRRQKATKRPSALGAIGNDFFDIVGQLAGVTNEWTGADKYKKKKR